MLVVASAWWDTACSNATRLPICLELLADGRRQARKLLRCQDGVLAQ